MTRFRNSLGTYALFCTAAAACTPITDIRLYATAELDDGSEVFRGDIHGAAYGDGVLSLRSDNGPTCVGTYGHNPDRSGYGDFTCSDGRSGTVTFASTGFRAVGTGELAGAPLSFTVSRTGR